MEILAYSTDHSGTSTVNFHAALQGVNLRIAGHDQIGSFVNNGFMIYESGTGTHIPIEGATEYLIDNISSGYSVTPTYTDSSAVTWDVSPPSVINEDTKGHHNVTYLDPVRPGGLSYLSDAPLMDRYIPLDINGEFGVNFATTVDPDAANSTEVGFSDNTTGKYDTMGVPISYMRSTLVNHKFGQSIIPRPVSGIEDRVMYYGDRNGPAHTKVVGLFTGPFGFIDPTETFNREFTHTYVKTRQMIVDGSGYVTLPTALLAGTSNDDFVGFERDPSDPSALRFRNDSDFRMRIHAKIRYLNVGNNHDPFMGTSSWNVRYRNDSSGDTIVAGGWTQPEEFRYFWHQHPEPHYYYGRSTIVVDSKSSIKLPNVFPASASITLLGVGNMGCAISYDLPWHKSYVFSSTSETAPAGEVMEYQGGILFKNQETGDEYRRDWVMNFPDQTVG